jgi:hypothetical protein
MSALLLKNLTIKFAGLRIEINYHANQKSEAGCACGREEVD